MQYILKDAACEILFVGKEYEELVEDIRKECPAIREVVGMDSAILVGVSLITV